MRSSKLSEALSHAREAPNAWPATRRFACGTGMDCRTAATGGTLPNEVEARRFGGERRAPPGDGRPEEAEDGWSDSNKKAFVSCRKPSVARNRKRSTNWRPFASCKPEQEDTRDRQRRASVVQRGDKLSQGVASREQALAAMPS